ncbi:Methyltransferase type 11 [Macleaya cordata]|uniref:Methyltransferase type 11 n=1 Tax=Macleaya cordata TaxID=56857 RepID=A0A200PPI3_MACCD|nr:Methyltransferase type 11 [Macleaya cordata]
MKAQGANSFSKCLIIKFLEYSSAIASGVVTMEFLSITQRLGIIDVESLVHEMWDLGRLVKFVQMIAILAISCCSSPATLDGMLHFLGGIEKIIMMDASYDMVKLCKDAEPNLSSDNIETSFVVGDEEFLPIQESSLDLVISCLGLHWTNDLPGAMIQCRLALKPDGLFLAAILGGETLKLELRIACTVAQMEREGGISPRLSPLAQVRDAGNLLTRAGFALPGVDVDEYTVRYDSGLKFSLLCSSFGKEFFGRRA